MCRKNSDESHSFVRLKPNVLMLYKETSSQIQDWDEMLSWWTDTWKTISPFCLYCSFTEVFLARMAYSYIISSKPWKCSTMLGSCLFLVRQKFFLHLEIHKPRTSVAFTHKYRFWDLSRWILTKAALQQPQIWKSGNPERKALEQRWLMMKSSVQPMQQVPLRLAACLLKIRMKRWQAKERMSQPSRKGCCWWAKLDQVTAGKQPSLGYEEGHAGGRATMYLSLFWPSHTCMVGADPAGAVQEDHKHRAAASMPRAGGSDGISQSKLTQSPSPPCPGPKFKCSCMSDGGAAWKTREKRSQDWIGCDISVAECLFGVVGFRIKMENWEWCFKMHYM